MLVRRKLHSVYWSSRSRAPVSICVQGLTTAYPSMTLSWFLTIRVIALSAHCL